MNNIKTHFKKKFSYNSRIYRFLSLIYNGMYKIINLLLFIAYPLLPLKKNKIVISSYYGKGYGDNGKYIVEEIARQKLNYDIVWLLNNENINEPLLPVFVRPVKYKSIKGLYEMATSKIWIDNCRKFFYPIKRKGQYYIQTWHGSIALKKVEKDALESLSKKYIKYARQDSKIADLFIANSKFTIDLYRESFWYNGKILKAGSPRNDLLLARDNKDIDKKVKEYFGILGEKRIVLYAPTFRNNIKSNTYDLNLLECLNILNTKYGADWVMLVRMHPNISSDCINIQYNNNIFNASLYNDMQELLAVSDVLITDYSSSMFDFALTNRPCFLYAPDIKEYKEERNLNFDIYNLPFPLAESNNELSERIYLFDNNEYVKNISKFCEKYEILEDGKASKRIIEVIKGITNQN